MKYPGQHPTGCKRLMIEYDMGKYAEQCLKLLKQWNNEGRDDRAEPQWLKLKPTVK